MGYTHYWYKVAELSQDSFDNFVRDFYQVLPTFRSLLEQTENDSQSLEVNNQVVVFNGIQEYSHETFFFDRVMDRKENFVQYHNEQSGEKTHIFNFCKTAQKPYDIAVTCALIIAKKNFGDNIIVSSDGGQEEWLEAIDLCQNTLGYGESFNVEEGVFEEILA